MSLKAQLNQNIKKVEDFQVEVIYPNIKQNNWYSKRCANTQWDSIKL